MIDVKNKTVKNGYGKILVSSILGGGLLLKEVEGEREAGVAIADDAKIIDKKAFFDISIDDIAKMNSDLALVVANEGGVVDFLEGWSLDFTKYNEKSVEIYLKALNDLVDLKTDIVNQEIVANKFSNLVPDIYGELMRLVNANEMSFEAQSDIEDKRFKVTITELSD